MLKQKKYLSSGRNCVDITRMGQKRKVESISESQNKRVLLHSLANHAQQYHERKDNICIVKEQIQNG